MKNIKGHLYNRETLAAHLPFLSYFYLKDDLTIFRLVEKKFNQNKVGAHVLHHPELKKLFDFSEIVYVLDSDDILVISLLTKGFNN